MRTLSSDEDNVWDSRKPNTECIFFQRPDFLRCFREIEESPPPKRPGIYGFYFHKRIPYLPVENSFFERRWLRKWRLLYIGLGSDLSMRILQMHFKGNASSSSLRLHLGCLLCTELKICLFKLPIETEGKYRYTFGEEGEHRLTKWLIQYARVAWIETEHYIDREKEAIHRYVPPLNIEYNPKYFGPLSLFTSRMHCIAEPVGNSPQWHRVREAYDEFVREAEQEQYKVLPDEV